MTPFQSYAIYTAIKLHFEKDSYDCFKYQFKTKANEHAYYKRRDKYFFAKLAKRYGDEITMFYASQFAQKTPVKYIIDMDKNHETYQRMKTIHESLSYNFNNDINKLCDVVDRFDDLFTLDTYPKIVHMYLEDEILLETVVLINRLTLFVHHVSIDDEIYWKEIKRLICKYDPFVQFDKQAAKKIVLSNFTS